MNIHERGYPPERNANPCGAGLEDTSMILNARAVYYNFIRTYLDYVHNYNIVNKFDEKELLRETVRSARSRLQTMPFFYIQGEYFIT